MPDSVAEEAMSGWSLPSMSARRSRTRARVSIAGTIAATVESAGSCSGLARATGNRPRQRTACHRHPNGLGRRLRPPHPRPRFPGTRHRPNDRGWTPAPGAHAGKASDEATAQLGGAKVAPPPLPARFEERPMTGFLALPVLGITFALFIMFS